MASRPPRVTFRSRQPTTGRGRIVRQPANPFVSRGTLAGIRRPAATRPPAPPAAPAAPATPAAPAGPQYSLAALPPDAPYDAALATLARQRDEGLAALTGERTRGLSDYGFTEGPGGTLAADPNNPYSKAALLKKTYDTTRRSTGQGLASGGHLYSGAFQNAQDLVNRNQMQSQDALEKSLIGFLARNTGQQAQARSGYETAAGQAYADRIARFQSNPLYQPAELGTDAAPAAAPAAAAPAPAARPASAAAAMRRRARATGARIGRI